MSNINYRSDLQGLRALSITLVVLCHAGFDSFSGGFVGVDVFFVLSGYLITGILVQEYGDTGNINIIPFVARRLRRLLPALALMLSITLVVANHALSNYEFLQQTTSASYAATWLSNFYFSFLEVGYFDDLKEKDLFLHTWSLSIEEQFYLFWPAFLLFVFKISNTYRNLYQAKSIISVALITISIASFLLSIYWIEDESSLAFYMMPSRIWQFSFGALIFIFLGNGNSRVDATGKTSEILGLFSLATGISLILGSAIFFKSGMGYPGFWALIPSIGAALVILSGYYRVSPKVKIVLANRLSIWLGDRSYSIYLWHWPILMLGFASGKSDSLLAINGMILTSILLAMISYRYVEYPLWKGDLLRKDHLRVILVSMLLIVSFVYSHQRNLRSQTAEYTGSMRGYFVESRFDLPIIYADGCDSWYKSSQIKPCVFGDPNSQKTVVLFGDSIGAQWFSLFTEIFDNDEWSVIVLTKSACPIADLEFFYGRIGRVYSVCTDWRNSAIDYLGKLNPEIIFIGNGMHGFSESQWVNGSFRILDRLRLYAKQVFVISMTPSLSFDGPSCLVESLKGNRAARGLHNGVCEEMRSVGKIRAYEQYIRTASSNFDNVKILNLNDLVCPRGKCSALNSEGMVVFRDTMHLTDTFVRSLVPEARDILGDLGATLPSN